ncbi:flagellar basal body P-ring formation chaperone FlgA [Sulfurospirillum sp. 1307]
MLLVISPFYALDLKEQYCIDDQTSLDSSFFGLEEKFHVIDIPKIKTIHKVPSLHVTKVFKEHKIEVNDVKSGIIVFKRNCDISGKKEELSLKLLEEFEKKYPCLNTEDLPDIIAVSTLPYDFKTYELLRIELKSVFLRKSKGSFKAIFKTPNGAEKNIYFKFFINAYIKTFKAKHKLYNDKILSFNDVKTVEVPIDKLPSKAIVCELPKKLMTKSYVSANSILSMNKFKYKKDILRGDNLRAYIRDGMLVITTPATALSDANIGDVIKVKTESRKIVRAKIVSKYKAIVLE